MTDIKIPQDWIDFVDKIIMELKDYQYYVLNGIIDSFTMGDAISIKYNNEWHKLSCIPYVDDDFKYRWIGDEYCKKHFTCVDNIQEKYSILNKK